ncbi:MAG TPA: type II secretion system protein [Duganella sp.]|nr:type II secretion system protein [Duganella sp.]
MSQNSKREAGLTIIELVIFMVITGVAAAGIMLVLNMGAKNSVDPLRRKQAMLIAEAYMEEVRLAGFTLCYPEDDNAATATLTTQCALPAVAVQARPGIVRPYSNVADYASKLGEAQRSFQPAGGIADVDVSGRALGLDGADKTMGNSSLAPIVTTVALNVLSSADPADLLGPPGQQISSTAGALNVLQITITTRYGSAPQDEVRLDGYRTRYAPRSVQ